jgi:hypothetical protein
MFRRNSKILPVEPPRVHTVRLLQSDEELRAAVERARASERRGSDEYQRRVGAYDRLLDNAPGVLATIVGIDPLRGGLSHEVEHRGRSVPDEERQSCSAIEA